MGTTNTQHPSPETTYSTASNAGKPGRDDFENKPLEDQIDDEQDDSDDEELETQNKDWK